jgi:hypothetical protein
MKEKTVLTVIHECFDLVNCPVCEEIPALRASCEFCGGAGTVEQLRLVILPIGDSGSE